MDFNQLQARGARTADLGLAYRPLYCIQGTNKFGLEVFQARSSREDDHVNRTFEAAATANGNHLLMRVPIRCQNCSPGRLHHDGSDTNYSSSAVDYVHLAHGWKEKPQQASSEKHIEGRIRQPGFTKGTEAR